MSMMIRAVTLCLAIATFTGCTTPVRIGEPAPIVRADTPVSQTPVNPPPTAPASQPAEVYAYQEPSPTAEAPPPSTGTGMDGALPSEPERATRDGDPASAPVVVARTSPQWSDVAERPALPAAADSLTRQAEQQRQARDYAGAAASLERALRVSPQSEWAYLYNRLSRVRLEQGLINQAGNLAAKSNAMAGDQARLKQDNWAIIAVARRNAGDIAGAAEAERMSRGG